MKKTSMPPYKDMIRYPLMTSVLVLALAGCSMEVPTNAPQKRVQLQNNLAHESYPVTAVDDALLQRIASDYARYGDGPLNVIVSYDPRARQNGAMNASHHAERIASRLRGHSVKTVSTSILPVNMQGEQAQVMFEYDAVTAHAPAGCAYMGGLEGYATGADLDYQYGCSIEMMLARQVARPKDLTGRGGLSPADGRKQAVAVEGYRANTSPPALSGYTID